jgi:hypothetical protein
MKATVDFIALKIEQQTVEEIGTTNWTGKLTGEAYCFNTVPRNRTDDPIEYRAAHPIASDGLKYLDQILGDSRSPRFGCIAVIAETSNQFGAGVSFSNKKAARQYASKKAVEWLIANEKMPADGSVRFPKVVQSPPPNAPKPTGNTYASQVPSLCFKLGFNPPAYKFVENVPGTALYDAWADFGHDVRVDGKVGEVFGVYGKKRAKEEVAENVIGFLRDVERHQRGLSSAEDSNDEEERKRKRSTSSSSEVGSKIIKV